MRSYRYSIIPTPSLIAEVLSKFDTNISNLSRSASTIWAVEIFIPHPYV